MGYPVPIQINATFSLLDSGILDIVYKAETEKTTIINLAHHSYFNLSGEKTILDQPKVQKSYLKNILALLKKLCLLETKPCQKIIFNTQTIL